MRAEKEMVERQVKAVIQEICNELKLPVLVQDGFCPGTLIKSQVLVDAISVIEEALNITIPEDCYIFSNKDNKQLSIQETVEKIIQVANDAN